MVMPDFQQIMFPQLEMLADEEIHTVRELHEPLADHFSLTQDERQEMLPSKTQSRFRNRVQWSKIYLQRAGLLENVRRGYFQITDRGKEVLSSGIEKIDLSFLTQFPEYNEWRTSKRTKKVDENKTGSNSDDLSVQTPEEALETAMTQIVDDLASEILEQVKVMPPFDFERLVLDLMVSMGYGGAKDAASLTRGGADEGIDGIINEDQLGLDIVYLQAKRWKAQVGRPEIQKFVGALHGKQARKGVFMSTSTFSKEAVDYVESLFDPKVILIDGQRLAELMIEFNVGVSAGDTFTIKRIDTDYFNND